MSAWLRAVSVLWLGLAVLAAGTTPAIADRATEARFFDAEGRRHYTRGSFAAALESFLEAHAAAPSAATTYNVALSAHLARREELAFAFFEDYLATDDDDPARRAEALRRRDQLARRLAVVRVQSDPAGAAIVVDRAELGVWGVTPRTIAVRPGSRTIRLSLADHEEEVVQVECVLGEARDVRASLTAHTGVLMIEGEPRGAPVTLLRGGQQTGAAIVGERTVLPVGSYAVRLEMEGGEAVEAYVRVVSSQVARVRLVAPPPRVARGRILVRAEGVRAEVRVNGELRGTTPLAIPAVPAGRYRVDLSREGYVPWSGEIVVREDRSTYVDVTLVPRAGG